MAGISSSEIETLRNVINHLNEAVYITDLDRRILLWNRKAEEITGYSEKKIVGKACFENILSHVDKDDHQLCTTALCPLHRAMRLNKSTTEPILVYALRADGRRVAVSVNCAPFFDAEGRIVGGIEVFRDESARMRDLEFAKRIQRHLLPEIPRDIPGYRMDVRYYPHDLVGGDFYDIREVKPGKWGMLIADVRGHGISAALYTMFLKSMKENLNKVADRPGTFVAGLNEQLCRFVLDESFATAVYLVLDVSRNEVRYTNAGHPPPLHRSSSGAILTLESHGVPLGINSDLPYEESALTLESGDSVLCYTDGITETRTSDGQLIGTEGLAGLIEDMQMGPEDQFLERLYRRVKQINGEVALTDDVLLLSLNRAQ
jgi:PAS domain S-box-containing protein